MCVCFGSNTADTRKLVFFFLFFGTLVVSLSFVSRKMKLYVYVDSILLL